MLSALGNSCFSSALEAWRFQAYRSCNPGWGRRPSGETHLSFTQQQHTVPFCDAAKWVCWLRVSSVRIICFVHLKVLTHRRNSRLGIAPDNRRCHCHISVAEHVTQTLYMLAGHKYARQLRVQGCQERMAKDTGESRPSLPA